jgi:hypothetical protein
MTIVNCDLGTCPCNVNGVCSRRVIRISEGDTERNDCFCSDKYYGSHKT